MTGPTSMTSHTGMTGPSGASGRKALTGAVLGCIAAGLVLVVALDRPWFVAHLHGAVEQSRGLAGRRYTTAPFAMGWLCAAAGVALLAVRGRWRVVLGVVVAAAGIAAAVTSWRGLHGHPELEWFAYGPVTSVTTTRTVWPWVAIAAGVAAAALGAWIVARGRGWPSMGERYDAPTGGSPRADRERTTWDALDHGHDPTA